MEVLQVLLIFTQQGNRIFNLKFIPHNPQKSHLKNTLIQKAFQSRVNSNANLVSDDIIGCASTVVWHKIKNISVNNEVMVLKLGRDVAPYKIYHMVYILMLLWQHAQF